jgi:YVTN family beta-propeller protein
MNVRWYGLAAFACAATFAGCGGGGSSGVPSVPAASSDGVAASKPAGGTPPPGAVAASISIVIPRPSGTPLTATQAAGRSVQYISPGGTYLAVQVANAANVNGQGFVWSANSANPLCTNAPTGIACTLPFYAQPGNDTIAVAELDSDKTGEPGLVLSENFPSPVPIVAGSSNAFTMTLYGVARNFALSNAGGYGACPPADGAPHTLAFNQQWLDDAGYAIDGPLWAPVSLAEVDASGAYSGLAPLTFQVPSPSPPPVSITYNGQGGNNVGEVYANYRAPDTGNGSVAFLSVTPISTPSPAGTIGPHYVYAAQPSLGNVAIVDICTRQISGLIAVPSSTALVKKLYLDLTKSNGYILAPGDNAVYYIAGINNTSSTQTAATKLALSGSPVRATLSPDGSVLWVTDSVGIERIVTTGTVPVVSGTPIPDPNGASGIAESIDSTKLYVAETTANDVAVISVSTGTAAASPIPVGAAPNFLNISGDGSTLAVSNTGAGTVSIINTAINAVTAVIPVGPNPGPLEFQKSNGSLWVVNQNQSAPTLSLIASAGQATATPAPPRTIPLVNGLYPRGLAISPVTNTVMVSGGTNGIQDYNRAGPAFAWGRSILTSPEGLTAGP